MTSGANASVTASRRPEAGQPGAGQHHRVEVAGSGGRARDAAQPGVDVAADVDHGEVGARGEQLGGPAGRAGAHQRTGRQLREREPVARAQGVGGVLTLGHRAEREPVGIRGRQVLEGVHGDVAPAVQQGVAQRGHEDAGAAQALQRAGQPVAVGADVDGLEGEVAAPEVLEGVDHMAGLREREGARAGADPHVLEHAVQCPSPCAGMSKRGKCPPATVTRS